MQFFLESLLREQKYNYNEKAKQAKAGIIRFRLAIKFDQMTINAKLC